MKLMKLLRTFCLLMAVTGAAHAAPVILAVQNAASNVPRGLPNSGIAQGSMFLILGTGLGPAEFITDLSFPLATSFEDTAVQVTVNGVTSDGIFYYTGPTQVAVILPSSTPVGEGTVTVTYNGETSPPFPVQVVSSALGIFTVGQNGSGDAIAYLGQELVTPTSAAHPGDIVSFWGTGLAPVSFDETTAAEQFNMTDVPLEAYVGGKQANIAFRGRNNCCSSIDAVYVEMPADVVGCATPVTFRSGNVVSNTTTVALAASGDTCTPANPAFSGEDDFRNWFLTGTLTSGSVGMQRSVSFSPAYSVGGIEVEATLDRADSIGSNFYRFTAIPGGAGLGNLFDITSYGACKVYSFRGQQPVPPAQSLDAGDPISVSGPPGNFNLMKSVFGDIISYSIPIDQTGTTLDPGTYTMSGPGGPDVGSFSVVLDVPETLVWTNQQDIVEVDRNSGVTVTWTGGDPSGYVQIQGYSILNPDGTGGYGASFDCTARTADGSYTLPSYVLQALPPSGTQNIGGVEIPGFGTLSVNSFAVKVFHADGLDYGTGTHSVTNGNSVIYQ
jgi:uncharacterized protein (TIGR03437 family)